MSEAAGVVETARLIAAGERSATEVTEAALRRIERLEPRLHAFITIAGDHALAEAEEADRRAAAGEPLGRLHGVPLAVKDLEATAGIRTTYGSARFGDLVPDHDSLAVERLRDAGAIVVGKTNTPEFGLLGETRSALAGETRNPWDLGRTTGGSSGGSAAAVAAGVVPAALGSDTAGSIPCPASMCGVFGLKPTRGLVPTWPDPGDARLFLDSGPLTTSVADARALLTALAGPDRRDPTSFLPPPDREAPARPLRIAWNPDWGRPRRRSRGAGGVRGGRGRASPSSGTRSRRRAPTSTAMRSRSRSRCSPPTCGRSSRPRGSTSPTSARTGRPRRGCSDGRR